MRDSLARNLRKDNHGRRWLWGPCPSRDDDVEYSPMFKRLIRSEALRRRTSWLIAMILILPFILFFHATGRTPLRGPGGIAGTLFGKPIPWETFDAERRWLTTQWQNQFGEIPESLAPIIIQSTWDKLMIVEEARHKGLRIADVDLARSVQAIPAFQEQGRFLLDRYTRLLQALGTSPQRFEGQLRHDLLAEQLLNNVKTEVSVSDEEVKAAYLMAHEALRASIILVDPTTFHNEVAASLTDEEVRTFYEAHVDDVRVPQQLVVEYAGSSREELASSVQLGEPEMERFYQDHQAEFTYLDGTPPAMEEIRETIRRRLVDERVRKQLVALAVDLEEDVKAGHPFEDIVQTRALRRHTTAPFPVGTRWLPEGPPPELLSAIATLREGEISRIIETDAGVFLARITQRIPSRVPPLDDVRPRLREQLVHERSREAARGSAETLRSRLKDQEASGIRFEEAVRLSGITPLAPAPFTRTQPIDPIGDVAALNEAAFRTPLGAISEGIETPRGFALVRPEERIPADASGFSATDETIRQEVLQQKQSERVDAWLKEMRARAKLQSFVETRSASEGPERP